ncbi:MAG: hypothetical protein IKM65_08535, partial [Bacteroidaceae bacterium]|nr:hypothetical protein [Bacteroidaceae bacterium]
EFTLSALSSAADVDAQYRGAVTADEAARCHDAMLAAQGVYNAGTTIEEFQKAHDALDAHYKAILAKIEKITAVDELPSEDGTGSGVLYDLSGRRRTTAAKGIFILNGRKVFIRR